VDTLNAGIYVGNRDSLQLFTMVGGLKPPTSRIEEMYTLAYFSSENDKAKWPEDDKTDADDDGEEKSGR